MSDEDVTREVSLHGAGACTWVADSPLIMAVREFTDGAGRRWRAWDVRPAEIHPATKSEDYLADCYITGWIVFETISTDEKRRLCPWPVDWVTRTDAQLQDLLDAAELVPAHHRSGEGGTPRRDDQSEAT